jgi:WD40 repeat protein
LHRPKPRVKSVPVPRLFDAVKDARAATEDKLEHLGQVTCSAFSPAGDVLLTGGWSGQIQVWEVGQGGTLKRLHKYLGHSKPVRAIAFSPDGGRVLSGGDDAALHGWTVKDGRRAAALDGFDHVMKACQWTADGSRALATDGASLFEFDLKGQKQVRKVGLLGSWAAGQAAAFSPDGATLVLGNTYDLRVFDTKTGKELAKLADNEIQWTAAFTPDGTRLLSGGRGKVNVWDLKARQKVGSIDLAGTGYVQSLAASPDSRYVAASPASAGQSLQVFRLPDPLK